MAPLFDSDPGHHFPVVLLDLPPRIWMLGILRLCKTEEGRDDTVRLHRLRFDVVPTDPVHLQGEKREGGEPQ